ncbi:MAG TPA: septal ring lytic transglycosylase RlpA family lipoprotein [Deltaproteobacteria bacterium]|nr:MAG: hypothetical protein A2048_08605 [Deltaproteobacteria bacterium GWA2_45_12]HBF12414.1 septal ring lytic transglycosylase RlpA family lipoprotein [Deltaproteobacteria bacterium]
MSKLLILLIFSTFFFASCATKKPPEQPLPTGLTRTGEIFYGRASWYGGKFHNRKTANGEKFDKKDLTTAHRTLPFGTLLEVTNLANEKSVVVRVNDRGPFIKKRILDLSHRAAELLDFIKQGWTEVKAEIVQ